LRKTLYYLWLFEGLYRLARVKRAVKIVSIG
jgi:hypothetical protein